MVRSSRRNRAANAEKAAAKDDARMRKAANKVSAGLLLHPLTMRTVITCPLHTKPTARTKAPAAKGYLRASGPP